VNLSQGFPDLLSIIDEIRARLIVASEEEVANKYEGSVGRGLGGGGALSKSTST
jgi:hypothetical protein